jgi:hypothetical protein
VDPTVVVVGPVVVPGPVVVAPFEVEEVPVAVVALAAVLFALDDAWLVVPTPPAPPNRP